MAYSFIGGTLAFTGIQLESNIIPSYKYFFSDHFGDAKRLEFLNYIRVENQGSGCYFKAWEFFIHHPVAAYRLLVTADVASRCLSTLGCAVTVTAMASLIGVPAAGLIGLNCLVLTPVVTKVLQFKWEELRCMDRAVRGIVLTAGLVSEIGIVTLMTGAAGSFATFTLEPNFLDFLSIPIWSIALLSQCQDSKSKIERDWDDILFYKNENKKCIEHGNDYSAQMVAEELEVIQARVKENGKCIESIKTTKNYLRLFVSQSMGEFHKKFKQLHGKIDDCTAKDLKRINEIIDELRTFADLETQLEQLLQRMLQLMPYENDYNKSLEDVRKHFKPEWELFDKDIKDLKAIYEDRVINEFYPQLSEKMRQAGLDGNKDDFKQFDDLCLRLQNPFKLNSQNVKLCPPVFDLKKMLGKFNNEEQAAIPGTSDKKVEGKAAVPIHQDAGTTCCLIMLYTCMCCILME